MTAEVVTLNEPELAPAGIEMLAGTCADPLLLCSATTKPPAGAGPDRVTVPLDGLPPTTVLGDKLTLLTEVVIGTGLMVRTAEADVLLALA